MVGYPDDVGAGCQEGGDLGEDCWGWVEEDGVVEVVEDDVDFVGGGCCVEGFPGCCGDVG